MKRTSQRTLRSMIVGLLMAGLIASPLVGLVAAKGPPACSDGADNDGDGLIDYPADPGCDNKGDKDEADGSSKNPPPRTYTTDWVGACLYGVLAEQWVSGTPLAGVTHAEFPISGIDVGRPFQLDVTLTGPLASGFIGWQPAGSTDVQKWVFFAGDHFTESGRLPQGAGTLLVSDCGSTASRAILTVS